MEQIVFPFEMLAIFPRKMNFQNFIQIKKE